MAVDIMFRRYAKESSGSAELDAQQFGPGDVLNVLRSPWPFTVYELTAPDRRILRLTNVDPADCSELIREERIVLPGSERLMRKRRARFNMESAAIPAGLRSWLDDDTRAVPIFVSNIGRIAFLVLIQAKAARQALRVL